MQDIIIRFGSIVVNKKDQHCIVIDVHILMKNVSDA